MYLLTILIRVYKYDQIDNSYKLLIITNLELVNEKKLQL